MAYLATHETHDPPRLRWPLVLMLLAVVASVALIAILMVMQDSPAAGNIHSP